MPYIEKKTVLFTPWQTVTNDHERDALISAMAAVEAREGERRGWSQPPRLWTLHLADIDTSAVEIRPVPRPAWRFGFPNPVEDLTAAAYKQPPPDRHIPNLSFADAPGGIAAVAFMTESWAADPSKLTDEQRRRHAAGERVLSQGDDRSEIRNLVAVDINGHGYVLTRVRNKEIDQPVQLIEREQMWAEKGKGPGRLVRALYCLAHAARAHGWPQAT